MVVGSGWCPRKEEGRQASLTWGRQPLCSRPLLALPWGEARWDPQGLELGGGVQ